MSATTTCPVLVMTMSAGSLNSVWSAGWSSPLKPPRGGVDLLRRPTVQGLLEAARRRSDIAVEDVLNVIFRKE